MYCANCGTQNPEGARSCQRCGRPPDRLMPPVPLPVPGAPPPALVAPVRFAGFWRRLVACGLDAVLVSLLLWACGLIYRGVSGAVLQRTVFEATQLDAVSWWLEGDALALSVLQYVLAFLYFALPEASRAQATPGKRLLHIRVTDLQQRRVGLVRAGLRNLLKPVSAGFCLIGLLMAGVTGRKQALHDLLTGCTLVVR